MRYGGEGVHRCYERGTGAENRTCKAGYNLRTLLDDRGHDGFTIDSAAYWYLDRKRQNRSDFVFFVKSRQSLCIA